MCKILFLLLSLIVVADDQGQSNNGGRHLQLRAGQHTARSTFNFMRKTNNRVGTIRRIGAKGSLEEIIQMQSGAFGIRVIMDDWTDIEAVPNLANNRAIDKNWGVWIRYRPRDKSLRFLQIDGEGKETSLNGLNFKATHVMAVRSDIKAYRADARNSITLGLKNETKYQIAPDHWQPEDPNFIAILGEDGKAYHLERRYIRNQVLLVQQAFNPLKAIHTATEPPKHCPPDPEPPPPSVQEPKSENTFDPVSIEKEFQHTKKVNEQARRELKELIKKKGVDGDWEYLIERVKTDDENLERLKRIHGIVHDYLTELGGTLEGESKQNTILGTWLMLGEARGSADKNTRWDPRGRAEMTATLQIAYNRALRETQESKGIPSLANSIMKSSAFSFFNPPDPGWVIAMLGPENTNEREAPYERAYQSYVEWKYRVSKIDRKLESQETAHYIATSLNRELKDPTNRAEWRVELEEIQKKSDNKELPPKELERLQSRERTLLWRLEKHWIWYGEEMSPPIIKVPTDASAKKFVEIEVRDHTFYQGVRW